MRFLACLVFALLAAASDTPGASVHVLWKEPPVMTTADWVAGPAGLDGRPKPPFRFEKEDLTGTNPKIDVVDAVGRRWAVKFGSEVQAETFAARILYAVGYATAPIYLVDGGEIENLGKLKRARAFVSRQGAFRNARFKLRESHKKPWSWNENPFEGSRELSGLKVMMMLLSNWNAKDARDGEGSNTGVFGDPSGSAGARFAVTDWGASFGKSGGFLRRTRWDRLGYASQTPSFAGLRPDGSIRWAYRGKHSEDITRGVTADDIRWLLRWLSRITDEQLSAGLLASGASPPAIEAFTQAIRSRIRQLEYVTAESVMRAGQ